ncbi:MAG: hypothetical protein ACTHOU_07055, partial [Aureliella sp.]
MLLKQIRGRALPSLPLILVALLFTPNVGYSQIPDAKPLARETDDAQGTRQLEDEVRQLKDSVRNLEAKLDRLLAVPSDFSGVSLRVESETGKPLAGFQGKLVLQAKEGRYVAVSGASDDTGLVLQRMVPYGKYHLSLNEPTGWSTYVSDVVVEIGKELELNIVAPDPSLRGEISLVSHLREAAFSGLPFGEIRSRMGAGYSIGYTPEPSVQEERSTTFPTVADGIAEVGVRLAVSARQDLLQSDGKNVTWRWSSPLAGGTGDQALVLVPGQVLRLQGLASKGSRRKDGG